MTETLPVGINQGNRRALNRRKCHREHKASALARAPSGLAASPSTLPAGVSQRRGLGARGVWCCPRGQSWTGIQGSPCRKAGEWAPSGPRWGAHDHSPAQPLARPGHQACTGNCVTLSIFHAKSCAHPASLTTVGTGVSKEKQEAGPTAGGRTGVQVICAPHGVWPP